MKGVSFQTREGLLIQDNGTWAEAAPLFGFSREDLGSVIEGLRDRSPERSPSLQFALESLKRPLSGCRVPVNALLLGSSSDVVTAARQLAMSACQAVKLKVGRESNSDKDAEIVRQVRAILRPNQKLRLDANRAWDFSAAQRFLDLVTGCDIEYIEEPLRDPSQLETLSVNTNVPYALDETLATPCDLNRFPSAAALIVKPTIIGGIDRVKQLSKLGKPLVFSGAFESGVGIARIADLGARYAAETPLGLDTYTWLAEDVLTDRLALEQWQLSVPQELSIRTSQLEEIQL